MHRLKWGWALDAMAEHLQGVADGDLIRLLMNVPPGMMKSMMTCVFFGAYEWGPMARPALRTLAGSYKVDLAQRDTGKMLELVTSDWFQDLWPHVKLVGKGTDKQFKNTATGWRRGRPVRSFTGDRGDRVIWDDPHSVELAESDTERKKVLRVLRETVPSRINDPELSAIIIIMQRLHEDDVSGMIIGEGLGYTHLMLPMRFEEDRRCTTMIGGHRFVDPRKYEGELLHPERFTPSAQDRTEAELTEHAVAGQMQQRPSPRGGRMFKRLWFEVVDAIPAGGQDARAWDLAGTEKSQKSPDPDWTVGLKGRRVGDGTFYITDMERFRKNPGATAKAIKNTATQDTRSCHYSLPQDPGQAGKVQVAFLAALLAGWPLTMLPVSGDKETRAKPAASQAEFGNIKIVRGDWNEDFFAEVCSFPAAKHDDIVDALSDLIDVLSTVATYNLDNVM